MTTQIEGAQAFTQLHVKGQLLVLFNAWDAGSAQAVARAGAKAIATGSWSVAAAHGAADGEALPLEAVLANLTRIVNSVDLPVSLDFEAGYARAPEAVARNIQLALSAGAIGFNIEDGLPDGGKGAIASPVEQAARLRAARAAADAMGIPAFINARTDLFLNSHTHDAHLVDQAIARAHAFADAGASGFFAPALHDEALIERLCRAIELPVNLMFVPNLPTRSRLTELGVVRLSYGPQPYLQAMASVEAAARQALSSEG